ncbi:MAG TPA: thiamine phosphate synthase [Xanthobacteraceae bacterium]|jgi:thiamine-phosphate pyrophosphorylase|nr:thiamine phosphate synthase [Xanthobacteraceae bacterium]
MNGRLPSRLLIVTDRHQATAPLPDTVAEAVRAGANWIWLRDRDLPLGERRALAVALTAITRSVRARLTIGGDVELAAAVGADGVHLAAAAAPGAIAAARMRLGADAIIGVSAHGDADVAAAQAAGADYATLSPIFATASKPDYGPELGLAALTRAARHGLPLLALGGITRQRAQECIAAGAAGIAVMGEIMRAAGPSSRVHDIVAGFLTALCVPANRR